jgi:MFS transporter, DHA3 family, macrolide efflux protein
MEIPGINPKWATPYFSLWSSQALTLLGSQLASFVLIWHLTKTTESATVLSLAMLVNLIPQIFLGPFAGVFIDRWSRKMVLISADVLIAFATIALAVLFVFNVANTSVIFMWIFILGIANGIINPSMLAITTSMVPNHHLTRLQGVNQTLQGGLNIIAAPLGALLYETWVIPKTLLINSLPALIAIICLSLIVVPQPVKSGKVAVKFQQDLLVSLRYILNWPALCMVIGIAVIINFLDAPATALIPLLVSKQFLGDALQLGWMNSIFGIGIVLGGLLLSLWGGFRHRMVTVFTGLIGMGLGALLVGIAPMISFWLAIVGIFLKGMMQSVANAPILSTLQSTVEPAMQGRVMSLVISATSAVAPLGLLIASALGDRLSAQSWFIIFGCSTVILGIAGFLIPTVLRLGEPNATEQDILAQ